MAFPSCGPPFGQEQPVTIPAPSRGPSEHPILKQWLILVLLATIVVATQIASLRAGHDWGDDFAQYIQQALNLAAGHPMLENGYIYNPSFPDLGPRAYPPGFPLLLTPVVKLAGVDLRAMKIIGIACFGLALLAIFRLLFPILPFGYCLATIAGLGFTPFLWGLKDSITSDIPFLCILYIALVMLQRCDTRHWLGTGPMVATGIVIYAGFAVRTAGGILLPALIVYLLLRFQGFRRIPRGAWIVLITAGSLTAIHLEATMRESLSYTDSVPRQSTAFFHAVHSNVMMYAWTLHYLFFPPWSSRFLSVSFCALLGGLCIWGYVSKLRSELTMLEIFAPFYLGVILVVPWGSGRYLIPLIPLGLMYIVCAIRSLPADGKWTIRTAATAAVAGGILGSCLTDFGATNFSPIKESFGNPDFMSVCAFLKHDTPPEAVVICKKPRLSTLVSGHRSSVYDPDASDKEQLKWFKDCGARYVLTSPAFPDDQRILKPFLERHRDLFRMTFRSGNFEIYQIDAG